MSKTYIVDGNSLLFRSFFATFRPGVPVMSTKDGIPTNAIYLYQKMLSQIKSELSFSDRLIVCFDTGKKSFRASKLESYKMNRKPIEPSLKAQLPLARELLDNMGILHIELEGYEGDDLAGSLTYYAASKGDDVTLFTSDKDFLQLLIADNVQIRFLRKGLSDVEIYTKNTIKSLKGYNADQVIDFKGLVGDPSDNIPGIIGVGEKTALKLLDQYPHLEDIFEGIKDDKSKISQKIIENKDMALFCREIARIVTNLDVKDYYEQGLLQKEKENELLAFYKRYELKNAYKELLDKQAKDMSLFNMDEVNILDDNKEIEVKNIKKFNELDFVPNSILVSNTSTNFHEGEIKGFYLSNGEKVCFLENDNLNDDEDFKKYLISSKDKYTYDLKGLIVCLNRLGLPSILNVSFDLLIATYILHQNVKQDKISCLSFYKQNITNDSIEKVDIILVSLLSKVKNEVIKQLNDNQEYELYSQIELPLTRVLANMEIEGFPIDQSCLDSINVQFQNKLDSITQSINQLIGEKINLNSPKQVGELIYDKLQLKKKGRSNSTSIDVLMKLYDKHPVIPLIVEYRKYQKLVSSYTSSLGRYIHSDNKIHAIFNQALTSTGRLSMSEPNLQNISIRDKEAKEIRKAFYYPSYEYKFLSLDYSQVELRVLASVAKLDEMIDTFNSDVDIHSATASKIFHVDIDQVTDLQRRKAKAVNFGIVYGISNWGLAEQVHVSPTEAKDIIESFYNSYPGLREFEKSVIEFAKGNGYVKTILNRRRYIDEINDINRNNAEFGERAAVNTVIQGSAADLIKVAMINISKFLEGYKTKMILQIHDELIFKVPVDEMDFIEEKLKSIMENAIKLNCRLIAEGSFGNTWYDCK
jgi:DNA polymerase I